MSKYAYINIYIPNNEPKKCLSLVPKARYDVALLFSVIESLIIRYVN